MASLIEHIAILRAYKKRLAWIEEDGNQGSRVDNYFAQQFNKEAGGAFYKHLEEVAVLLSSEQSIELAEVTAQVESDMAKAEIEMQKLDAVIDKGSASEILEALLGNLLDPETKVKVIALG